jgi:hypothetical protein
MMTPMDDRVMITTAAPNPSPAVSAKQLKAA